MLGRVRGASLALINYMAVVRSPRAAAEWPNTCCGRLAGPLNDLDTANGFQLHSVFARFFLHTVWVQSLCVLRRSNWNFVLVETEKNGSHILRRVGGGVKAAEQIRCIACRWAWEVACRRQPARTINGGEAVRHSGGGVPLAQSAARARPPPPSPGRRTAESARLRPRINLALMETGSGERR